MKFNPIIKNIKREKLIQYFIKHNIFKNKNSIKKIEKINNPFSDEHISQKNIDQFGPELFDLYRLSDSNEVVELGLEDMFPSIIALVEWPERMGEKV